MKTAMKCGVLALALMATPMMAPAANAETDFSITLGNAAFGYRDGYWDRDHHWHHWRNRAEYRYYRDHYGDHYYPMRHSRERDHGWRGERWWDHS